MENLQMSSLPLNTETAHARSEAAVHEALDPRILSSVILSLKMAGETPVSAKDAHERLLEIMHSRPVKAILTAASLMSQEQSISAADCLQQIVVSFQEMNRLWDQVLLKEGLARLSSQYH